MTVLDEWPKPVANPRLIGGGNGKTRPSQDPRTGRFLPGGGGGPGRPRKEVERQYLDRLRKVVTLPEWEKVVLKALEDAQAGDSAARTWLSKYLVGDDPLGLLDVIDRLAELEQRGASR